MRTVIVFSAMLVLFITVASAQTETTETRTTETQVDTTANGKVKKVETVTAIATSRDITPRENMLMVDPIRFYSFFNVSYQRALSPLFSLGGRVMMPTQFTNATGAAVTAEANYYPGGKVFKGFHFGGNVTYNGMTYDQEHYNYDPNTGTSTTTTTTMSLPSSIGVNIGWHWYPWEDFTTEVALGADYNLSGRDPHATGEYYYDSSPTFMNTYRGLVPTIRFNIGYAW